MSATSRRSGGAPMLDAEVVLLWIAIAVITVSVGTVTAAAHVGAAIDGDGEKLDANPFTLVLKLAKGDTAWPAGATPALIGILVVVALLATAGGVLYARRRGKRSRVDRAASRMGRGRDLEPVGRKQAAATAKRLGVETPGLVIARTVAGGRPLYQGWEDVSVDVWGPRVGQDDVTRDPGDPRGARRRARHVQQARHRRRDARAAQRARAGLAV